MKERVSPQDERTKEEITPEGKETEEPFQREKRGGLSSSGIGRVRGEENIRGKKGGGISKGRERGSSSTGERERENN